MSRCACAPPLLALALFLAACSPPPHDTVEKPAPKPAAPRVMPDIYRVRFTTTRGSLVVEVHKDWAPLAAERFWRLLGLGFFDNSRVFRVRPNFVAQFGVSADPKLNALFTALPIADDPVKQSNLRGTLAFAQDGPRSRRTQIFINLKNNQELDRQGFAPFARIVEGDAVPGLFYSGYPEMAPRGAGPDPNKLAVQGDSYAETEFPRLEIIRKAVVVP
jgi:peptidyl-prolyl cis-trans isomerase A (cyclophilin A)